jgi:hypothetical protein
MNRRGFLAGVGAALLFPTELLKESDWFYWAGMKFKGNRPELPDIREVMAVQPMKNPMHTHSFISDDFYLEYCTHEIKWEHDPPDLFSQLVPSGRQGGRK